jgi:hypothetical protein
VLVDVLAELPDRALDRAVVVHRALREEAVEVDPEPLQRALDPLHHVLHAQHRELVRVALGRAVDFGGELGDVVALVAALRRLLAAGARPDRLAEEPHLGPVVVDVVLALDRVAGELEQP